MKFVDAKIYQITRYDYPNLSKLEEDMAMEKGMPTNWKHFEDMGFVLLTSSPLEQCLQEYARDNGFGDVLQIDTRRVQRNQTNSLVTQILDGEVYLFAINEPKDVKVVSDNG